MEQMSFRTKEDFVVELGDPVAIYTIKRLKFKNAESVLGGLLEVSREIGSFSMRLAAALADAPKQTDQQRNVVFSLIETMIPALMSASCFGIVKDTLEKISGGVITKEVVAELDYEEAVKLLTFLIDKNFESLKNLYASLQTLTTRR